MSPGGSVFDANREQAETFGAAQGVAPEPEGDLAAEIASTGLLIRLHLPNALADVRGRIGVA